MDTVRDLSDRASLQGRGPVVPNVPNFSDEQQLLNIDARGAVSEGRLTKVQATSRPHCLWPELPFQRTYLQTFTQCFVATRDGLSPLLLFCAVRTQRSKTCASSRACECLARCGGQRRLLGYVLEGNKP